MIVNCDLWLPLEISRRLGPVPVPMFTWFCWHYANARAILASRTATDPFPTEGM